MQLTRPCTHQTLSIGHLTNEDSHCIQFQPAENHAAFKRITEMVTLFSLDQQSYCPQSGSTEAHTVFSLDLQRFTLSSVWIYREWYCPLSGSKEVHIWIYRKSHCLHSGPTHNIYWIWNQLWYNNQFWPFDLHSIWCAKLYKKQKQNRITKWINRPGLPPQMWIFPSSFLRTSPHSVSPMFQQAFAEDSETRDTMTNSNIIIN